MARRKKAVYTSNRDFIKINLEMKDKTIAEIAKRLGMRPTSVLQRRCKINKVARVLPALHRGRVSQEVNLQALAAEVQAELDNEAN